MTLALFPNVEETHAGEENTVRQKNSERHKPFSDPTSLPNLHSLGTSRVRILFEAGGGLRKRWACLASTHTLPLDKMQRKIANVAVRKKAMRSEVKGRNS